MAFMRHIPTNDNLSETQRVFNRVWDAIGQIHTVTTNNTVAIASNSSGIASLTTSASSGGSITPIITNHVELRVDGSNNVLINAFGRCNLYSYSIREVP